ncbi:heparinase II/III-family protein [Bosea sp. (in: a-proteobacteria)]|uniref:heparinase II/III family protein n=1 Tax=Bosea sp. (in: a-proteobacteria) TaxID=1871050 RepID=UPI00261432D4|nr:heparinase II/III-family protein [Bosea sp. (in: a-proteobacteria)]MCO5090845.1 heparinase II/III-family protein [Bosea sp. (in: a-proteobacteria)]
MRIGWYANRLRGMGSAEILHRLREQRRRIASRNRDDGWRRHAAPDLVPVLPELREKVSAATPAQRQAIAEAAEGVLAGRFSALGQSWPPREPGRLFPPRIWRLDPATGALWPGAESYTFDIDLRPGDSRGDIKYVWEINRLQFLLPLAAQLRLTGCERCRESIEAAIESWHAGNPPFRGVGWASGIEVALRAASLIVALDLAGDRLDPATGRKAGEILAASAYWLARFPSLFSSANNHLVAELAGRYLIGLSLGARTDAVRKALLAELDRQILADGTGAEQTPSYAAFTAEAMLLCAAAAQQAGEPFPPSATARLAAFAGFVAWLPARGGRFGDDDDGRLLTLGAEDGYVRSVAAAIHGFLRLPGEAPEPGDIRALVFGAPPQPAPAPEGLRSFERGGLSIWRGSMKERAVALTFDHGPLGYLAIAAHGHADALSLTLCIDGDPVLVDPGTWLYGSGGVWRDWFRSTPAHNTLNLDGASQSIASGPFNWSHKADATLVESKPGTHWRLSARHDGYRGRFGVLHQRSLARDGDAIVVTDRLLGRRRTAEIVFQLAADIAASQQGSAVTLSRGGRAIMTIRFPDAAIAMRAGGERPGQGGWVSPRFGVREPATRLAWRGEVGEEGVTIRLVLA